MNIDELYEQAMYQEHLYSICQHQCDGMSNCKMFAEGNDIGCLKAYHYYLNLIKNLQSENLTKLKNSAII